MDNNGYSRIASIANVVIDTVAEIKKADRKQVELKFNSSKCKQKLFNQNTHYYMNDIETIISDFIKEKCSL